MYCYVSGDQNGNKVNNLNYFDCADDKMLVFIGVINMFFCLKDFCDFSWSGLMVEAWILI